MDFGNAAIDGGFCDPDSIIPIDSDVDDEFFCESAIQSFRILQDTVARFLGIAEPSTLYPNIGSFACTQYVQGLVKAAMASEARPSLQLDRRLPALLSPTNATSVGSHSRLKKRAATYAHFAKRREELTCRLEDDFP